MRILPKSDSNQSFSHRVLKQSTEIPRPVSSKAINDFQWKRMANSLVGERHSDTAAIQRAVKAPGGGEAGYKAGVAEQKRIRIERELRKLNCLQREEERTGCKYNDMKSTNPETTTLIGWGQSK